MNRYRLIIQPGRAADEHRAPRGDFHPLQRAKKIQLSATNLVEALHHAQATIVEAEDRIVSIEEIEPTITIDDDQLLRRLTSDDYNDLADTIECLEDRRVVGSDIFESTVIDIINALANTEIIPGLTYSMQKDESFGDPAYIMLELFDDAAKRYISTGRDLIDLIEDRDAEGQAAVLSIARAIITVVNLDLR